MLPFRLHSVSFRSHYIKLVKMGMNSVGFIWHSHLLVCTSNTNSCAAALLFSAWVHPTSLAPHLQIFLKETTLHYFEWLSIPGAVIKFENTTHKEQKKTPVLIELQLSPSGRACPSITAAVFPWRPWRSHLTSFPHASLHIKPPLSVDTANTKCQFHFWDKDKVTGRL